jgi:hypothetical protein
MSAFSVDSKAMIEFQLKHHEYIMYSRMIHERVSKMGLGLLEREQEYGRLMMSMPDHLRRKDDPLYKPYEQPQKISFHNPQTAFSAITAMRPPVVTFEDEIDLEEYYEGSSVTSIRRLTQPGTFRENHQYGRGAADS